MTLATPRCPSCEAPLSANSRFCPRCGRTFDEGALPTMTSPSGAPSGLRTDADQPSGHFPPGAMIGTRYRVAGLLGRGGMGDVYRADDLQLGQPVALKFLPADVERDPARLEQFISEVRLARQVAHPNVCRVYDIGEAGARRFLSMEYIDGEDLRSLLRRIGRLPEDKALEIARQIAAGLHAMHDRGIVHRDLKPANVMLDGAGRVRLTDFGLAANTESAGRDGAIAGTPQYMAPEQLAGGPLSPQTDIYALGLVLWEIFTGERVHKATTIAELRDAHRGRTPLTLSSSSGARLDPAVQRVIEQCLERDPQQRPASALAVSARLPGGDPIAAALAAGETPSPQMVAASGAEGALAPKIAIPCLVALLAIAAIVVWLNGRASLGSAMSMPNSPDVLASNARDLLQRLGETSTPADAGWGFGYDDDFRVWLEEHDKTPARWQRLATARVPPIYFWYRTSPAPMLPGLSAGGGELHSEDPPLTTPGMTLVRLDPAGRLSSFRRAVSDHQRAPQQPVAVNWTPLFESAGLAISAFRPATPEWVGPVAADVRAAWIGPGADTKGSELRVEAAALQGRPVFFRLITPWTRPAEAANAPLPPQFRAGFIAVLMVMLLVAAGGAVLAIRHLRLGRADARGGGRLAAFTGATTFVSGMMTMHYAADVGLHMSLIMVVSFAAFIALVTWTFYVAVEPHIRRRWPKVLISWSRLVEGRWRDPLVGRDLLLGSLLAVGVVLIERLAGIVSVWRGAPPEMPFVNPLTLPGTAATIAALMKGLTFTVCLALGMLLLLVILRILVRSERAAALSVLGILCALSAVSSPFVEWPLEFLANLAIVVAATRLGFIALVALFYCGQVIGVANLSFTFPGYLAGAMAAGALAMIGPGVFGWFTSMARARRGASWLDA